MAAQLRWEWDSPGRERAVPGPRGRWFFVDAWSRGLRAAGCGLRRTAAYEWMGAVARGCHAADTWTSCDLRP
jgi:hypothetical protein